MHRLRLEQVVRAWMRERGRQVATPLLSISFWEFRCWGSPSQESFIFGHYLSQRDGISTLAGARSSGRGEGQHWGGRFEYAILKYGCGNSNYALHGRFPIAIHISASGIESNTFWNPFPIYIKGNFSCLICIGCQPY